MEVKINNDKIILLDEGKEIGKLTWTLVEDNYLVDHTYIDKAYRGQNLGMVLVNELITIVRSQGKKIIPICPYVDKVLSSSSEYEDVLKRDENYNIRCNI